MITILPIGYLDRGPPAAPKPDGPPFRNVNRGGEAMPAKVGPERIKRRSWLVVLLTMAVGMFVVAGCGGDDSSSSSSKTSSSSSSSSGGSDAVKKAEAVVATFSEPPSSVGTDVALSKKPPSGKNVIAMSCTLDVCKNWRDQVATAAKALGWTSKGVSFDGTPEDSLNKVKQAVSDSPDGIIINGVPRETYDAAVAAAKAANVPIVTQMGELEGEATPPFVAVQDRAVQFDKMAEGTGDWV